VRTKNREKELANHQSYFIRHSKFAIRNRIGSFTNWLIGPFSSLPLPKFLDAEAAKNREVRKENSSSDIRHSSSIIALAHLLIGPLANCIRHPTFVIRHPSLHWLIY